MAKKTIKINIDNVVDLIIEGKTYREIAKVYGVKLSTLVDYFAKPEHSARVREALSASADIFSDMAEQVLLDAKYNPKRFDYDLKKARELSQYYKWKASKRSPKKYGDKLDVTTGGEKLESQIAIIMDGESISLKTKDQNQVK